MRRLPGVFRRRLAGLIAALMPVIRGLVAIVVEGLRIVREMLVIPAQLWLAVAESVGAVVLAVWLRLVVPVAIIVASLARRALSWAQIHVTPGRAAIAVATAAAVALAASQFVDYRGVSVGTPAYAGVETVAPAPEVGREHTGAAHAWVMLPIAAAALVVIVVAARGRWRTARLLIPLGLIVIAVSILVDWPKGLDEGAAATSYEGAKAALLEGFWAQLAAGLVLIVSGPLLAAHLRPRTAEERSARPVRWPWRRRAEPGLGSSPVGHPPIQGTSA
jgi:hypothetical protein